MNRREFVASCVAIATTSPHSLLGVHPKVRWSVATFCINDDFGSLIYGKQDTFTIRKIYARWEHRDGTKRLMFQCERHCRELWISVTHKGAEIPKNLSSLLNSTASVSSLARIFPGGIFGEASRPDQPGPWDKPTSRGNNESNRRNGSRPT